MQSDILSTCVKYLNDILWGWPLILFFIIVGVVATIALKFIQVRYFTKAWSLVFSKKEQEKSAQADMSPFGAFVNALSTSIGNGSLAGMATAIHEGGPGAAFWIFVIGFFALPIRFSEVYLSGAFEEGGTTITTGGPMVYLKKVPGGAILPAFYAFFCLMLSFVTGNGMQANSITCGLTSLFNISPYIIAFFIFLFVLYVILGGAERIVRFSEKIVPLKVGLFFISAFIVLIYHSPSLLSALKLILVSAFTPQAIKGSLIGTTMQSAIRFGMSRLLNATEVALGTAAVFFGSTGGKHPVEKGIMSIVTAFISNYMVCFILALLIVVSGVWSSDITSVSLTTAAYGTVFGSFANLLVTILSIVFGIGVMVGYAYIGKECWSYLTGGRFLPVYSALYCILAFLGSLAKVQLVWDATDVINAGLVGINLYAILFLMPKISKAVNDYMQHKKASTNIGL